MMHLPIAGIVSGGQSGPLPTYNRVVFDYSFPVGIAGAYTPIKADTIVCPSGVTLSAGSNVILDADGNAHSTVNFQKLYDINNVAAKTTSIRKYEMWGTTNGAYLVEGGVGVLFNYVDANNYWEWRTYAFSSGEYRTFLRKYVSGTGTFTGTAVNLPAAVQTPLLWYASVYDLGDRLHYTMEGFETDTTGDIGTQSNSYNETNRPHKTATRTFVTERSITVTPGHMIIRGFRITDL